MDIVITIARAAFPYVNWVLSLVILILIFRFFLSFWLFWRTETYKHKIIWVQLQIKVPRETLRGPKAMEQFFAGIYPLRNTPGSPVKKWWDGEVPRWHVIDIIGKQNEMRFFLRVSTRLRHAVEGMLYAQYPEIEISDVEDPLAAEFPKSYEELRAQGYEIFGNELYQSHAPAISIRTYDEFEEETGDEKGRVIDPFAVLLELISNLKPAEMLLVQYVIVPDVFKHWRHEGKNIMQKLRRTTEKIGEDEEGKPKFQFRQRSPGEEVIIKRIEEKEEKATFETTVRYMYISPRETYNYNTGYRGIQTFFNQYKHDNQALDRNLHVMTKAEWYYFPFFFAKTRLFWKRKVFYDEFIYRFLPEALFAGKLINSHFWRWCFFHRPTILSSEEMATLFHIPTNVVLTQSTMERIESKRLAAPSNIPK